MELIWDKTPEEAAEAMKNGTNVIVHYVDEETRDEYWLNTAFDEYASNVICYSVYADGTAVCEATGNLSNNRWR